MSEYAAARYLIYADDDEDDQEIMKELLPEMVPGMGLITKDNGMEVLNFLNEISQQSDFPVLIILDLNMPGWDGIQTLKEIRKEERYSNVPILIFSTTNNATDRQQALSEGAVGFVSKPSHYTELQTIIKSFTFYFDS